MFPVTMVTTCYFLIGSFEPDKHSCHGNGISMLYTTLHLYIAGSYQLWQVHQSCDVEGSLYFLGG